MNNVAGNHMPVLSKVLAEQISVPTDGIVVDATVGHGGHSLLFAQVLGPEGIIIGLDADEKCVQRAQTTLNNLSCRVVLIRSNFADIAEELTKQGIEKVDLILADLGVCSAQWTDVEKGLSFQTDMPLDMRLDNRLTTTAADIINRTDEKALADLIFKFGQDRASRRIARFIVRDRKIRPINTTGQLAAIVCRALARPKKGRRSRIHPATRTFQALRIAVNDELNNLQKLLEAAPALLKKGAYIAIISFHSLEDRLVKHNFKSNDKDDIYKILTKKPIVPSRIEIVENPRARSSKLRIAQRR